MYDPNNSEVDFYAADFVWGCEQYLRGNLISLVYKLTYFKRSATPPDASGFERELQKLMRDKGITLERMTFAEFARRAYDAVTK